MCENLGMLIMSVAAAFWARCNLEICTFGSPTLSYYNNHAET